MVCKSQKCDKGNHHQFLNIIIQKDNFSFPDFCLSCGRAIRLSGVRRNLSGTVTGASSSCSEGHKAKVLACLSAWPNTLVCLKFGNFQNFVFVLIL